MRWLPCHGVSVAQYDIGNIRPIGISVLKVIVTEMIMLVEIVLPMVRLNLSPPLLTGAAVILFSIDRRRGDEAPVNIHRDGTRHDANYRLDHHFQDHRRHEYDYSRV